MSELIKSQNLLGSSKIIVGDKSQNLVLANAGSIYIQYGGSYKKLQDIIKEQVDKGIEEYKQSVKAEQENSEKKLSQESEDAAEEVAEATEDAEENETENRIAQLEKRVEMLYLHQALRHNEPLPLNCFDEEPVQECNAGSCQDQELTPYEVYINYLNDSPDIRSENDPTKSNILTAGGDNINRVQFSEAKQIYYQDKAYRLDTYQ